MKALTICQPWAWAIIHGPKRIENRTWPTSHRGLLAIHAGKSRDYLNCEMNDGSETPPESELVFGAILGTADLIGCVRLHEHRVVANDVFAEGPWCWVLEDIQAFNEPVPWRGQQGIWDIYDDIKRCR